MTDRSESLKVRFLVRQRRGTFSAKVPLLIGTITLSISGNGHDEIEWMGAPDLLVLLLVCAADMALLAWLRRRRLRILREERLCRSIALAVRHFALMEVAPRRAA